MYQATVIYPETIKSIDSATFTGAYQLLGASTSNECRVMKIVNNSTKDVTVSWDGVNDHDFVPSKSFTLYDFSTNRSSDTPIIVAPKGTQLWVKGSAGGGLVYLISFFGLSNTQGSPL